jgi:hypothetical protein
MAGSYTPLGATPEQCYCYLRERGGERLLVALNFSTEELRLAWPRQPLAKTPVKAKLLAETKPSVNAKLPARGELLISTHLDRREDVALPGLALRPYEGVLVRL